MDITVGNGYELPELIEKLTLEAGLLPYFRLKLVCLKVSFKAPVWGWVATFNCDRGEETAKTAQQ